MLVSITEQISQS